MQSYQFPKNFIWGAATASYQIEGATDKDGRKPSVWDTFSKTPGRVKTGDTGDIANDHYHLYESDIKMMADMGIKNYRFSIAWPRILPNGTGTVNEKGIDFYKRILDCLQKYGITPYVTLFHWDSPQALEDRYGSWRSRQIADDFAEYVSVVVKRLGDRVSDWMTVNEIPCFTNLGYSADSIPPHAPGTKVGSQKEIFQTVHNALLAHGKAVMAIRAHSPQKCRISLADNVGTPIPVTESEKDIQAAKTAFKDSGTNGMIIYGILKGEYSDLFVKHFGKKNALPDILDGDMKIISQPLDRWCFNIYTGVPICHADNEDGYQIATLPDAYPRLDMPWLHMFPEALYWAPRLITECAGFNGEIVISENGCAAQDIIDKDGRIMDLDRIRYLRDYIRQLHRAYAEGYKVNGYFIWSLMDNFEWAWGFSKRFGIIYNIYETQKRILKESAKWYAECIKQNRAV